MKKSLGLLPAAPPVGKTELREKNKELKQAAGKES
jgi:hypothetical protein